MIARLVAALVRLIDAYFPPTICAHCRQPIRSLTGWGDNRYPQLFCTARCQRSWEEA